MSLSVNRVVNALLWSDELYCPFDQSGVAVAGAANAVNTRQSFRHLHLHFINPTIPTHPQVFVLSPVSLASSPDQDGGPSNATIDIWDLTEK